MLLSTHSITQHVSTWAGKIDCIQDEMCRTRLSENVVTGFEMLKVPCEYGSVQYDWIKKVSPFG